MIDMKYKYLALIISLFSIFIIEILAQHQHGTASFYSKRLDGRKTQNGDRLNSKKFTAAHRSLPFGTLVKVTNVKNDKWCIVKINDRGRFKKGRIIDITYAAAKELEMIGDGITNVKLEIWPPNDSLDMSLFNDTLPTVNIKKQSILLKDTLFMEIQ